MKKKYNYSNKEYKFNFKKMERIINYDIGTKDNSLPKEVNKKEDNIQKKLTCKQIILIVVISTIIVVGIIVAIILFINHKNETFLEPPEEETSNIIITTTETDKPKFEELGPLEMQTEYKIKTNINDLKRIYINQKSYKDIKINGVLSKGLVDRKTNYDIFIFGEIPASEEAKYYYNKTYLCSISISSECLSLLDEYCIPKKLVDLIDQDYSHVRNLQQENDLENLPIPLCFFNLTDNNVITSISCHKNIPEEKVNSIVLDLYFFRPPGIKRLEKEEGNITIQTFKDGNNEVIREINGDICNIEKAFNSYCSTDMNTTKDSEGNLISYNELAFTNITTDQDNSFIKNKFTYLLDKTDLIQANPEKYNETLNRLYPLLEKHLKNYEQFSIENFKELYYVSKGIEDETQKRNLLGEEEQKEINYEVSDEIFRFKHYGNVQSAVLLKNNVGLGSINMMASAYLLIDDTKKLITRHLQDSDIDVIIKSLKKLSEAGNNLAYILYQKINSNLNNISEIISNNITLLNNLVVYEELSDLFDSTFSLNNLKSIPKDIINESDKLVDNLDHIYTSIGNGEIKKDINILNDYISQFTKQSHQLVINISNNLKDLGNLIKSPKQAISDVSNYYLNHTSNSYLQTIEEAKNILYYYYINESDLIVPEVDKILEKFEIITMESLKKQINLVTILNNRLKNRNLTIDEGTDNDYEKIKTNIENSNNYISTIINLFKTKVKNVMDLKNNGYFISKYDIEINNETFHQIIDESIIIAKNLDNNEYVDVNFDKIMTKFRQSYTTTTKYMEEKKESIFAPDEDILSREYFKKSEIHKISADLKEIGGNIAKSIINENNKYIRDVNESIKEFLDNKRIILENLILDLDILFSEEKLEKIAQLYNETFKSHLNKINQSIFENQELTSQYFDEMVNLTKNNKEVVRLLEKHAVDKTIPPDLPKCTPTNDYHCVEYTKYEDNIRTKKKSQGYFIKYNDFKKKFQTSKNFINNDINPFIIEEYKNIVIKLKEILLSFKKNKISDLYPHLSELYFIDDHIKIIDNLYTRLNYYISNDKFNNYYLPLIQNFKIEQTNKIIKIEQYIENQHREINIGETGKEYKDFCTQFTRIRTFTCRNKAVYKRSKTEDVCLDTWGTNNLQNLKVLSIYSNTTFDNKFNEFYLDVKNDVDNYSSIINQFKEKLLTLESTIINNKDIGNYLLPIEDKKNSLLIEKYSNNLIQASYNFYKNHLEEGLDNLFIDVSNEWNLTYYDLEKDVRNNLNNFTNSIYEFGLMSLIYQTVISQNQTNAFYKSIIDHQKSEFNYTISYYYNILIQNMTSIYQFICSQIPKNQEGFNSIINIRKNEVYEIFNKIINDIQESKKEALSIDKQLYVIDTSTQNFFKTNAIFANFSRDLSSNLKTIGNRIYKIRNSKNNDEISLACRFYLENSLNGLQIKEFYQPINNNIFIYLDLENFKKLLTDKWIFDEYNFIRELNDSKYDLDLEIENELEIKKKQYKNDLESEITSYYTKETIASKVVENYNFYLQNIDKNMENEFTIYINKILDVIIKYLSEEEQRIKSQIVTYTNDYTEINNRIKEYKNIILNKSEGLLYEFVDTLYENIHEIAYKLHIEKGLNNYLLEAKKYNSTCHLYNSISSSYSIGLIIYEYVNQLVSEYKNFTSYQIENKREENRNMIKENIIDEFGKLFDYKINPQYSKFLNELKKITKDKSQEGMGFTKYDFDENIKNNINIQIDSSFNSINNTLNKIQISKKEIKMKWPGSMDFEGINEGKFKAINNSFTSFIVPKITNEKNSLNSLLKDIIRNNFNILLNNLMNSFGEEFFERIIKYNENFKIKSLYDDLKYSLVISLTYYKALNSLKKQIKSLTEDLKIKLYNLNNLDEITSDKNEIVLKLLNSNADEFIEKSMNHLIKYYKEYLEGNTFIKDFIKGLSINLGNIVEQNSYLLENDYKTLLNEKFKTKFVDSFTKVMNERTQDMIDTVDSLKIDIKLLFDELFSLDVDAVLNQTNKKMNETLDSIKEYNNHIQSFQIPENLIKFINSYGANVIQPSYRGLESLINKETKNLTYNNLIEKYKNYKMNYNEKEFIEIRNNIYSSLKNDNIESINNAINETHGIENYPDLLKKEIDKIDRRNLRILEGKEIEPDNSTEESAENSLYKILNISDNTKRYIDSYENFENFNEIINNYIIKLNISFKDSNQSINDAFGDEDEVSEFMHQKLDELYNFSFGYYNKIKESYNTLKSYIEKSIDKINDNLIKCANITYETIDKEFKNITQKYKDFQIKENKKETDIEPISNISGSQNTQFTTEANIENLEKKYEFTFSLKTEGEGKIKTQKLFGGVINQIKPEKLSLEISEKLGNCSKDYQTIDVEFNNISYISNIIYDTQTNLVNLTTLSNFDAFKYWVKRFIIEPSNIGICFDTIGIGFCLEDNEECSDPIQINDTLLQTYKQVNKTKTKLINY